MAFSELQIALLGAGATAVATVWGYNAWQERKHRKAAEKLLRADQPDALFDGASATVSRPDTGTLRIPAERIEPRMMVAESAPQAELNNRNDVAAPAGATNDADASSTPPAGAGQPTRIPDTALPAQWADPAVDCILRFSTDAPVPAAAVWAAQMAWAPLLAKPLRWLARENLTSAWQLIDAGDSGSYAEWVAVLQLADRRGVVSDGDLGRFLDGVRQIATQTGSIVELPSQGETLKRAGALDDFCASVDIQFSLHIVEAAGGLFAGTRLRGLAEASGLTLGNDGRFHARDSGGCELFALSAMGQEHLDAESFKSLSTPGLTLTLDVPRCADGAAAFDQMLVTAQQMTRVLGGMLVDAQRVPLAEAMITGIRAKTIELQQGMRNAGIEPGGTRALRLFA